VDPKPRKKQPTFAFRLRLPKVIKELESALRDAREQGWKEADRNRACDIAFSLAGAFQVEEFRDAAVMARSLGCLMKLTPDQIKPIESPFQEKLQEIMSFLKETADQALTGT
jgi:hypothetical protein